MKSAFSLHSTFFLYTMLLVKIVLTASAAAVAVAQSSFVNKTLCGGKNCTYEALAGYGFIPNDFRDKLGDTLGGIGSAIALDLSQWKKKSDGSYSGVLYGLPDRGW
jgi:hypothetical protein